MKLLSLIPVLLVASTAAAKTKTVSFSYDYDIDYVKVKANVICVTSIDARENGDGEEIESEVLWFAASDYSKTKELKDAGYKPILNGEKGEQCDSLYSPGMGLTPHITVYTYAYISKKNVEEAMKREGKSFVERVIVFKKSSLNREILEEVMSTARDDVMSEIWKE